MSSAATANARPANRLLQLAEEFADALTSRVSRVVNLTTPFSAIAAGSDTKGRVSIAVTDALLRQLSIPLTVNGTRRLLLFVKIQCCWDRSSDYLAVDQSFIHVRIADKYRDEPLFRYEFLREPTPAVPAAHLQVHGHRDEFVYLLLTGDTPRGRRRVVKDSVARLAEFHFPLGGHRFRPCLEDVLEALANEFGIDVKDGWREAIREGREEWRRMQLRAAVRDAPRDVAEVLRSMGYEVIDPAEPPADRLDRLQSF